MAFRTSIMLVVITLIHLVGAKSKEFCDEKKSDKRPTGGAEICLQGQLGFGQLVAAIFEKNRCLWFTLALSSTTAFESLPAFSS